MLLNRLQHLLESIYEVHSGYLVADFLIDDPGLARELDVSETARELPEKLLIHQQGEDAVSIALYLDRGLLQRLKADDPTVCLHRENLHDFCLALEGISHFLYFTWNAMYERRVSLLEMELQAEVDKYVLAAFLFRSQRRGEVPPRLHHYLFHNVAYDTRLTATELVRYRSANYLAAEFCCCLESMLLMQRSCAGLIKTLRRFYRLTQRHKISAIERLGKSMVKPGAYRWAYHPH
jgi:hypothetical protein